MSDASEGYTLTVQGLLRKCGELHGEIERLRAITNARMGELERCSAAVRVFKPDVTDDDLPQPPAPPPSANFRGEIQRFMLNMLRGADMPLRTSEIAAGVMDMRGLDRGDRVMVKLVGSRTSHSLSKLRGKGLVESRRYGHGAELDWWISGRGEREDAGKEWRNGSD